MAAAPCDAGTTADADVRPASPTRATAADDAQHRQVDSPIGALLLSATATHLCRLQFPSPATIIAARAFARDDSSLLAEAQAQLAAYFSGRLQQFDLPLLAHGTPFQQRVWAALTDIPYGTTISYRTLAQRIDQPSAVRAVGAANGRNPLPIFVPCHRVIGADGTLTGFGGGLPAKRLLLQREGVGLRADLFDSIR